MTNDIKDWSTTPASNDIADPGINWQEGMPPSAVNNSARGMMAAVKSWWDESRGGVSAYAADTGVADVYAIAPAPTITAYATGQTFHFFAANANTGVSTVNVNALGPKAIQKNGAALAGAEIGPGDLVIVIYDGMQFQLQNNPRFNIFETLTVSGNATFDTSTLHVDSVNDKIGINLSTPSTLYTDANNLVVGSGLGAEGLTIYAGSGSNANIYFADGLVGDQAYRGYLVYDHTNDRLRIGTAGANSAVIDSSGNLDIVNGNLRVAGNTALPVNQLVAISANDLDHTVDELLIWDNSASAHRKIGLDDFGVKVVDQASAKTFALTDANTMQESTSATAVTWTVPPNSSVNFSIGTVIQVFQSGAGQVTIAPGAAVLLRAPNGLRTSQQYAVMCIIKVASDTWVAYGDVAA